MDKSLGTFFQCTLAEPLPLPPQTTLNACIHNFFPSLKILYGGGGRTVRKVRRACAGYEGNQKEALPPSRVVARVGRYSPASRLPLLAQKREKITPVMQAISLQTYPLTDVRSCL